MDWGFNTILFEQLEQEKFFHKDFKEKRIATENKNFENAEYAIIWHLKEKEFMELPQSEKLLYLELNWANLKNFGGIGKYNCLKRLELHYCVKLESDEGLSQMNDSLEFLHLNQSRKFNFTEELLQLKKLKVLRLNSCAPIDNLNFLRYFPNLIDFRFVDTNILDGNLIPILEHPTIRTVGFLNKRHYNYTDKQMKLALESKNKNEYEPVVF